MVKQGCCSSASGRKVAAEPEPDHTLRCQNSHLIENFESVKKCGTSWRCDRCDEACVERWECTQGCDYDICNACYSKHWEDVVQQACKSTVPFEAVQMLKVVPEPQRQHLENFTERAASACAEAVADPELFGGIKALLDETRQLCIPPPAACSAFLSRQIHDDLLQKDGVLKECEAALSLAREFSIPPSTADLVTGLNLHQFRNLKLKLESVGHAGVLAIWHGAMQTGLQATASAELKQSMAADAPTVLAKLQAIRDVGGVDLESEDFKESWPHILRMASEDPQYGLELLLALPPEFREGNDSFTTAASAMLALKVVEASSDKSKFLDLITSVLAAAQELGIPCPPDIPALLSRHARTALNDGDEAGCESIVVLGNKYGVEPSWADLAEGLSMDEARRLFGAFNRKDASKWQAGRTYVLCRVAAEELSKMASEELAGVHDVKSKIAEFKGSGVSMDNEMLDPAWIDVLALAAKDPAQGFPLLIDVPKESRSRFMEAFASTAAAAVECEATLSESLDMCDRLGVAVPESVAGKVCDGLCASLEAKDWPAMRQILKQMDKLKISIDAEQLLAGFQPSIQSYCFLIQEQGTKSDCTWLQALRRALPGVAAEELDLNFELDEAPRLFLDANEILSATGVSLDSLPDAGERAAKFLTLAVRDSVSPSDAQELTQLAVNVAPDADALLDIVPEEMKGRARDLLDAFSATWRCAPNGDCEVDDDRWLELPQEWGREAEKGFRRNQTALAQDPPDYKHRKCDIKVDVGGQACELHWEEGTTYCVDFKFFTCLVTEPKKRGRIVPLRRHDKSGKITDPSPDAKHPWYNKQVQDHDAKEGDWMTNDFFFKAFTEALKSSGVTIEEAADHIFDFRFNEDFRDKKDDGRTLKRGGEEYRLPFGWKRYAVSVKGEYDKGDNAWLRSGDEGWAIAYHGTADKNLPGILSSGFRVGPRQKFKSSTGAGVYCTPFIDVASAYAPCQQIQGHSIQIVLQLRVKPSKIKRITTGSEFEQKYWVINDPADMRAYGVLIRESTEGGRLH